MIWKRLNSLAVFHKIALTIGLILLLVTGVLAFVALKNVAKLSARLESVHRDAILPLWQAELVNNELDAMQISLLHALETEGVQRERHLKEAAQHEQEFSKGFERYSRESTNGTQPAMLDLLRQYGALEDQAARERNALETVNRSYPLLKAATGQIRDLLRNGQKDEAKAVFNNKADSLFNELEKSTAVFMHLQLEQGDYSSREAQVAVQATRKDLSIAAIVTLSIGLLTALFLARIVVRPLRQLLSATQEVAKGNLSYEIPIQSRDEIGELAASFTQMLAALRQSESQSARNLAERERIEAHLQASAIGLSEAQQIGNMGSWEWDVGNNKVTWSDQLYRIFGLEPQEFGGTYEAYLQYVYPDDLELVTGMIEAALRDKTFSAYSNRILSKDGTVRTIQAYGKVSVDETGNVVKMTGTAEDVTESRRMECALRQSEERFQLATRATNDVMWDWDIASNRIWWNDGIHTVFGYELNQVGDDLNWWLKGIHPEDAEPVGTSVHQFLDSGDQIWTREYRYARADGSYATVIDRGIVVRDGDGKAVRMIGSMLDITKLKQIEIDLGQARDAALESARAKSEFLANMSHEIRTPLNGVIGMTGLLLNTKLTPQQRRYAETAGRSGDSLLMIINDILDFSKIEAGKMSLETTNFDLNTILENAAIMVARSAHVKNLEVVVSVDGQLPTSLQGDPLRLSQILTNLANNAVKFTERGEIVLSAQRVAEAGDWVTVRFEVRDTGIGISPDQQARLFQPFTQADSSTTRKYGGTGLGLVISSQIVNLMGGEIGVESSSGGGSLFWFTVSLAKASAGVPDDLPSRMDLRGMRVLVVDDNATNRFILHEQILSWQMSNGSAENGSRALELLRAAAGRGKPYHLAILDLQMPEMSGLSLARAIQADPLIAGVVLILLTSVDQTAISGQAAEAGIAACLSKPARQSDLYDCMVQAMRLRATEVPPPADTPSKGAGRSHIRILVAEDNIVNREVALGMLEAHGYTADAVVNGREAVEAVSRTAYAAVLMDCQMPEMDGYTATGEIRKLEGAARHIPIIAMTAHALPGEREKCLAAGMDDYLAKPVRPEKLYDTLERWIPNTVPAPNLSACVVPAPETAVDGLDLRVLDNLRKLQRPGAPDLLSKIIDLFLQDTPAQLAAVREVASLGHAQDLARLAHALKGSSANLGARHMVQICTELEGLCSSGDVKNVPEIVTSLESEFDNVRAGLQTQRPRS